MSDESNVVMVSSSIIVPAVKCGASETGVAFFVLLNVPAPDSPPSAIAGLIAQCWGDPVTPHYFAVWLDGVDDSSGLASWTPLVGDRLTFTIAYASGTDQFAFSLTDFTQHKTTTSTGPGNGEIPSMAACGVSDMGGPLANFGVVTYQGCKATVGGSTKPIGSFGSSVSLLQITLVSLDESTILAQIGKLSSAGNFHASYEASGP